MKNPDIRKNSEDAEISYAGIIAGIKNSYRFLLKRWWILLIGFFLGGATGWLYCFVKGTTYTANCSFTVQGQSASSSLLSSALSLASSLGISSKGGGPSSYDNNFFANLMQSRRIVKETYLQEEKVNGKKDILGNHFIQVTGLAEKWEGDKRLGNFKFKHTELSALTRLEDSVLTTIYDLTLNDDYLLVNYEADAPFNNATYTCASFDFSRKMMKHLLTNTSTYYLREMFNLNNSNLMLAEKRLDSIANAIHQLDSRVARLRDNSNNIIKQSGLVELNAAIRDQGLLNIQYSSAVNNYELAKVSMLGSSPVLDVIDDPMFSTDTNLPPVILSIIGVGILFFIMTAGGLLLKKFISTTVENENAAAESESSSPVQLPEKI